MPPETVMDFQTSMAEGYELVPVDKSPLRIVTAEGVDRRNIRAVVPIGKVRLVRPTRSAMDFAVRLLMRTPLRNLNARNPDPDRLAMLERNVLAITRRIGPLNAEIDPKSPEDFMRELVWDWIPVAKKIQTIFNVPPDFSREIPVGNLSVYISFNSGRPSSMAVRPARTADALIYHAAQMIASGTRPQPCKWCKTQFLIGGPRTRGKKKAGARFCSEQCRWDYNNARRKKG
jgi:hypothetical protein